MNTTRAGVRSMMLRLVLVGIVAGLGVTIPSRPVGHGWLGSAERWANSLLADWDSWRPDDNMDKRVSDTAHECEQCRLARAAIASAERKIDVSEPSQPTGWALAQPTVATAKSDAKSRSASSSQLTTGPVIAFDSIDFDDEFYAGVAFELNKKASTVDLVQLPAKPVVVTAGSQADIMMDRPEMDLPEVLCGATDEDLAALWPMVDSAVPQPDTRSKARVEVISNETVDDVAFVEADDAAVGSAARPVVAAKAEAPVQVEAWQWLELIACGRDCFDADEHRALEAGTNVGVLAERPVTSPVIQRSSPVVAVEPTGSQILTQAPENAKDQSDCIPWPAFAPVEPIASPTPTSVVQETTVPWPVFAPVETPVSQEAVRITETRDVVESISSSAHSTVRATPNPAAESGLGEAVHLTRQAVSAWLSVLVRSGPVEVTAR